MTAILLRKTKCLVFKVYRPPNNGNDDTFEKVLDSIQMIINDHSSDVEQIIVCGNMNFPFIIWPEGSC